MIRRVFLWPERRPGAIVAAVALIFVLAYSASLVLLPKPTTRLVVGDALHYYVYLRSLVFDRDLHFANDYQAFVTGIRGGEDGPVNRDETRTPTGHVRNLMSVGPAVLWAPLFLLVTAVVSLLRLLGIDYPLDGYAPVFQASAFYSGILAAAAGAWLTYRLLHRWFGARVAIWSTLTMWLGSSAIYYSVVSPAYSHAASMLAAAAFFYVWGSTLGVGAADRSTEGLRHNGTATRTDRLRHGYGRPPTRSAKAEVLRRARVLPRGPITRYAVVGAMGGMCALMRWQDAVFLVAPVIETAWFVRTRRLGVGAALSRLAICGAAAIAAFAPQMLAWMVIFGQPIALPQGSGFMRWDTPHLVDVLFSDWHGLFPWTPVTLPAVAGLALLCRQPAGASGRERQVLGLGAAAAFAAAWYVNASVADWWGGEAFGARRFVSCFPVLALGLAAVLDRWRDRLVPIVTLAAVFVVTNMLLLVQYQAFMHGLDELSPYPRGFYALWVARFVVPVRLVAWALSGT